jgi:hypothetical protein
MKRVMGTRTENKEWKEEGKGRKGEGKTNQTNCNGAAAVSTRSQ